MNTLTIEPTILDKSDGNLYLAPHLLVDGIQLANFSSFAVDMVELRKSLLRSGDYFILTCWCGEPSCMGIEAGIRVTHEGFLVRWHLQDPFDDSTYEFSLPQLKSEFESSLNSIRAARDQAIASESKPIKIVPRVSKDVL